MAGCQGSHPAWVCGLKPLLYRSCRSFRPVTPCVGVWIETLCCTPNATKNRVTPCVGVWIETKQKQKDINSYGHTLRGCVDWNILYACFNNKINTSHPAWVCGLKQLNENYFLVNHSHTLRGCVDWNPLGIWEEIKINVTPCVGVWIETPLQRNWRKP